MAESVVAETESASATPALSSPAQLPLAVRLRDDATLDNFLAPGSLQSLIDALRTQLTPDGEPIIYLYGAAGSGKSHLLQAGCQLQDGQSLYLPLGDLVQYPATEVLQGLGGVDRVCLDDIQAVLGNAEWEIALFNFYNQARQQGCRMVVAADAAPRGLDVGLEDLRSRLAWGVVYQLAAGNDEDKVAILRFRAARRGLTLSPSVASYIVSRAPRALAQLLEVLDKLDEVSLVEQHVLSIPFVKKALDW